jgi:Fic family protein
MYIHEHANWTDFRWDANRIALLLDDVCREQGRLYGRLSTLGFDSRLHAMAENLTRDVVYSSEIEGIRLNADEVRSSIARRLGIENVRQTAPSHYVDAVVAVMLDAMEHYDMTLTSEKLWAWQAAFFPSGLSDGAQIEVGRYRTNEEVIVSGYLGRERVHYRAPGPARLEEEMKLFINWFNTENNTSPIIRSAIAHFWFVSIHPFEDGNGRLARILGDMYLARADRSRFRFYNISTEINRNKKHYYDILERLQRGNGDITEWLVWYLEMVLSAIREANATVSSVLCKNNFWMRAAGIPLTERQADTLNRFLDGYEAKITTKMWAQLNKCSKDTAIRDIQDLIQKGILVEDYPGAKRPSYSIVYGAPGMLCSSDFTDVEVNAEADVYYLSATYKGIYPIRERVLRLDAERFLQNDLPLDHLLDKYCSYIAGI